MKPKKYFTGLNYSMANEDAQFESNLLKLNTEKVAAIAGSGNRVLALLAKQPSELNVIDLSKEQILLTKLRISAVSQLSFSEYTILMGYASAATAKNRKEIFYKLHLEQEVSKYFEELFEGLNWDSFLLKGRWESTFCKLSKINRFLIGSSFERLFQCNTLEQQREWVLKKLGRFSLAGLRWRLVLLILGNSAVFNALLYKGSFAKKNIPYTFYQLYWKRFLKLFQFTLVKDNFFLNLVFFGSLQNNTALPFEAIPENFDKVKMGIQHAKINYFVGDSIEWIANASESLDFISLSNVPSYFSGHLEFTYLNKIKAGLKVGGIMVQRLYLHHPEGYSTQRLQKEDWKVWSPEYNFNSLFSAEENKYLFEQYQAEKIGVYDIEIFERAK